MSRRNYQIVQMSLSLTAVAILLVSFYFQYVLKLAPCPLCIMQRICVLLLAFIGLLGFFLTSLPRAKKIIIMQAVVAGAGLFFAIRQLWLQWMPSAQMSSCMPGLDILMQFFSWWDVLHALFWGDGSCAENTWSWLGISMPGWTALYFLSMLLLSSLVAWQLKKERWQDV